MSKSLSSRSLLATSLVITGAAYSGLSYAADEAMEPEVGMFLHPTTRSMHKPFR